MKKTGLFKIIMFILLGMIVASWIFGATYFEEGNLADLGMNYTGLFDGFSMFFKSFLIEYFAQVLLLVLSIGALYGVLEQTGVYKKLVDKIVDDLKGREFLFIVLISLFIAILTSVFDYGFALFIFFPLLFIILLAMGYDKPTIAMATFGAMIVGIIGNTIGYNTAGIIARVLNTKANAYFYYKLALLLIGYVVLLLFLSKAKRHKVTDKGLKDQDLFIETDEVSKKSTAGLIVVLVLLFVFLVLGCTNWETTFNLKFFSNIYDKIMELEIKLPYLHITTEGFKVGAEKITLFGNLFGDVAAFGTWYYSEMTVCCALAALLVGFIYGVNPFEGMLNGIKKVLKPTAMLFLSYVVLYFAANLMFYPTIAALLLKIGSKFSVVIGSIIMALGSFFHVDSLFVVNYAAPQLATKTTDTALVALLTQSIYGVVMLIAPTSIFLTYGLTYLGITYKEWVKKTWKFTLILFVIVEVVLLVANYL